MYDANEDDRSPGLGRSGNFLTFCESNYAFTSSVNRSGFDELPGPFLPRHFPRYFRQLRLSSSKSFRTFLCNPKSATHIYHD